MRIAIPVWNGYISPVLDTARRLIIYEMSGSDPMLREEIVINPGETDIAGLIASRVDVIICGALSRELEQYLTDRGVSVHPWIMGEAGYLIKCYAAGKIRTRDYSMPGCRGRYRNRCCENKRFGSRNARSRQNTNVNGE